MNSSNPRGSHPLAALIPEGASVLWAASSGGHFAQLKRIEEASSVSPESHWVTFDTPQTAGALEAREDVTYVDYVSPRDVKNTLKAARRIKPLIDSRPFDLAISTGSALAAAVLPLTRARGIRSVYVESIARTDGPSLTGRLMALCPGVETFTQYRSWADRRWKFVGSVLDTWRAPTHQISDTTNRPLKIFVTLGTIQPYRFDRLIDAVASVTRPGDQVTWQVGCTDRQDLIGEVHDQLTPGEFHRRATEADVVVTHSGVGTILQLLDMGTLPVIAPRSKAHAEHVDDHQHLITTELSERNLSRTLDLDFPDRTTLLDAGSSKVLRAEVG